jgi:4-methylaminobutanoate oxidase (formaldehyde-forming)
MQQMHEEAMPNEAAVVIIGGGIFGCSIAYHLAKKGARHVVLLEKNAMASGTTPMAAGLVPQLRATEWLTQAITYSIELYENFAAETGCSSVFQQVGSMKVALTDERVQDLEAQVALGKRLGIDIEFLSSQQTERLVPTLCTQAIKAMTFAPRDGFVNPHLAAVGFATAAHRLGVTIYTHTPVHGVTPSAGGAHTIHTARGEFHTAVVVDAAGAWTRWHGEDLGLRIPVMPVRHQYFITAPVPGVSSTQPVVRFPDLNAYMRQENGGLLVGGFEANPLSVNLRTLPPTFDIKDTPGDVTILQDFRARVQEYVPILGEAFWVAERRGLPTMTPDGDFLLGDVPGIPGLYLATGCCVTGISAAPILGKLLAELIVDGQPSLDISPMHIRRFSTEYADPAVLRQACEAAYAHYYALGWGKI